MDVPVTVGPPASALPPGGSSAAKVAGFVSALDVRIDVKGAYIVDESSEEASRQAVRTNGAGRVDGNDDDDDDNNNNNRGEEGVSGEFGGREEDEDVQRDSRDIRLPHQRSFVSHMAIDVSTFPLFVLFVPLAME
jgi:hypothetical protein